LLLSSPIYSNKEITLEKCQYFCKILIKSGLTKLHWHIGIHITILISYNIKKIMEIVMVMEEKTNQLANNCNFMDVRPVMADLPYPPVQAECKNLNYANLLSIDYCGAVSEMSAVTQYINNENRLSCERCPAAKTILGIAMAEMIHLQKLGEMVSLLGGNIDFTAKYNNGKQKMWTPQYISIPQNRHKMILADIEAEKSAISQYRAHIRMIRDKYINAVLSRIIMDEEYHIMLLNVLAKEL